MKTLNLGILAHVDAGKTSLTERLLHVAGVLDAVGSVDAGTTRTDTLDLERRRGITIKAAVVGFTVDDVRVNLIDTPGHPDFIAEVDRSLGVLDGVVLVVSAVEGVQPQTRVLMRALRRLRLPTLVFVNKIDRRDADPERVLREIAEKLALSPLAMGTVTSAGSRAAEFAAYGPADHTFAKRLLDVLSEHDDAILTSYVQSGSDPSYARLRSSLAEQSRAATVHPVYFGSAGTGAGADDLLAGITDLLPAVDRTLDAAKPPSAVVFKVERGPAGEKIAYVRVFTGTLRIRDRFGYGAGHEGRITAAALFENDTVLPSAAVPAGQIGQVWGLGDVRIGDVLGDRPAHLLDIGTFAPPTLATVVEPCDPMDRGRLHAALTRLAEQDPLIGLRHDEARGETSVSLYGEVQKEVIQATLAEESGLAVRFRETSVICVERIVGAGVALDEIRGEDNPFLATIGLRIGPAPVGAGVAFGIEIELGSLPPAFLTAVEDSVRETLKQGLHGWQIPDADVTLTRSGYWARQSHAHGTFDKSMSSTAGDFRNLTPLVLMEALQKAGTAVLEPMHRFRLDLPAAVLRSTLPVLAALRCVLDSTTVSGAEAVVEGLVPAARVHPLEQRIPGLTGGEGSLEYSFDRFQEVDGIVPERNRIGADPLDRKEYLLRVQRRV